MTLDLEQTLDHWAALGGDLHRLLGGLDNDRDYDEAAELLEALDRVAEAEPGEAHTILARLLAERLTAYDERHHQIPDAAPGAVLAFLMEQHGLRQDDLSDIADQGTVSRILSGKRTAGKKLAEALARRFRVDKSAFL